MRRSKVWSRPPKLTTRSPIRGTPRNGNCRKFNQLKALLPWNGIASSIDIDHLSVDELVALDHHIIERLKMLESLEAHKSMMQFHPGARVSFDAPVVSASPVPS